MSTLTPELETLLTVWALSQEAYRGPVSHAIPKRLMTVYRRLLRQGAIAKDKDGPYLEDQGSFMVDISGLQI